MIAIAALLGIAGTVGGFYAAGYRAYVIHTGSMVPDLVPGDLIVDRPADGQYRTGDVITFRHGPTPDLVTHRLTQITPNGIHTKGDANRTADVWTIPNRYVEGVVKWTVPALGYVVVFLQQPTGLASVLLMLAALALLWQLFFPSAETTRTPPDDEVDDIGEIDESDEQTRTPPATSPDDARPDADDGTRDDVVPAAMPEPVGASA